MKTLLQGKEYTPSSETNILKTFLATGWIPPSTRRFGKIRIGATMKELGFYVDIEGERLACTAVYETERNGYKPLIYGIFDENDKDITLRVPENEFDRIYDELCQHVAENLRGME